MLDIGWSELLLIAVVAIVVIGPKELPDALRSLGRMMTKLRRMAGEFQGQFNAALREANLEEVKREFDAIRESTSVLRGALNPVEMARNEIKGAIVGPPASSTPAGGPTAASAPLVAAPQVSPPQMAESGVESQEQPIPSAFATAATFRK
jgi:sec-independent protein translocase protein TatB